MDPVEYGYITTTGMQRDHNEDCVGAFPELGLWVVADGMGGHEGGEIASELAVNTIKEFVSEGGPLEQAIQKAHTEIIEAAQEGKGNRGMGSTVVALRLNGTDYEIAWVGDSRAYLFNAALRQLTRDHSYVQELLDSGAITPEEAQVHPQKNIISRALGAQSPRELQVDSIQGRLCKGQKILLCSDGLTGEVEKDRIADILQQEGTDQELAEQLVQTANSNGGRDNTSVVLCSAPPDAPPPDTTKKITQPVNVGDLQGASGDKRKRKIFITLFLILFLGATVLFWQLNLFQEGEDPGKSGGVHGRSEVSSKKKCEWGSFFQGGHKQDYSSGRKRRPTGETTGSANKRSRQKIRTGKCLIRK